MAQGMEMWVVINIGRGVARQGSLMGTKDEKFGVTYKAGVM